MKYTCSMETVQQNGRFTLFSSKFPSNIYSILFAFDINFHQEIYRPGTTISDASNLCTAVGGDQNKEFRGNASFLREKRPKGWNKNILYFSYWSESQKSEVFALTWYINLFIVLSLQLLWGHWVCLHSSHRVQYTICVYLSWAFLDIVPCTRSSYQSLKYKRFIIPVDLEKYWNWKYRN